MSGLHNYWLGLVVEGIVLAANLYVIRSLPAPHRQTAAISPGLRSLAARSGASGLVIAAAIVLAKVGGSVVGGAASSFPAVLLSGTVITRHTRGVDFSNQLAAVTMFSAGVNIAAYVTLVRFTYVAWGIPLGTLCAFGASLVAAFVVLASSRTFSRVEAPRLAPASRR